MRIGFAFGSRDLINALEDVKFPFNSYTMNAAALTMGAAAVKDREYFNSCCGKIVKTREESKKRLKELGFTFPDSKTNFIFAKHRNVPAAWLFEELKKRKIFVRYFPQKRIDNYLRITVGTDEQNVAVVKLRFNVINMYLMRYAERSGNEVLIGMSHSLIGRQLAAAHHLLNQRMILGDLENFTVPD